MKYFLIATATLMAGTAALAQTAQIAPAPVAPSAPMAHPMDDKIMTRNEVVAMVRDHFGRLDADKNGSITTEEAMKSHGQRRDHARPRRAERSDPNAAFDRLDANKDGAIGRDEFAKAHEQRIEKRIEIREHRQEAARDGKGPGGREFRGYRMGGMMGGRMIVMADSNHDGNITLGEAESLALQHFDQMDSNHDGQVTPEERRSGRPMIIKKVIEEKKTSG